MRPPWQRVPWQELSVEIIVLVGFTVFNVVLSWIGDFEPVYVSLIGFGSFGIAIWIIANYEQWRAPLRRRLPTSSELMKAVDQWLGENDYTRGPTQLPAPLGTGYYERVLEVSYGGGVKMWIAVEQKRKLLVFLSQRGDPGGEIAKLGQGEAQKLKLDLALEVARIGALYQAAENPYGITFGDTLSIDESLNAGKVIEKTVFIQRVDNLINNVFFKYFVGVPQPISAVGAALNPTPPPESTPDMASPQPQSEP